MRTALAGPALSAPVAETEAHCMLASAICRKLINVLHCLLFSFHGPIRSREYKVTEILHRHLILIHGTFGRAKNSIFSKIFGKEEKKWYQPESDFYNLLSSSLRNKSVPSTIDFFEWSGHNTVRARAAAAEDLAEKVNKLRDLDAKIVLVAHSHAGNVVLSALKYINLKEKVEIITLASPFIQIEPADLPKSFGLAMYLGFAFISLLILAILFWIFTVFGFDGAAWIDNHFLVFAVIWFFTTYLFQRLYRSKLRSSGASLSQSSRVISDDRKNLPHLILRAPNDEADLAMAVGTVGNIVCSFVLKLITLFLKILPLLILLAFIIRISVLFMPNISDFTRLATPIQHDRFTSLMEDLFNKAWTYAIEAFLIGTACKMVYGWDLFFAAFGTVITQSTAPDCAGNTDIRTITHFKRKSLTHYIYDNPECAKNISQWLSSENRNSR